MLIIPGLEYRYVAKLKGQDAKDEAKAKKDGKGDTVGIFE